MPSISKIKAIGNTYNLSPSNEGTLTGYTSGDEVSPNNWVQVNAISSTESINNQINKKLLLGILDNCRNVLLRNF